MTPEEEVRNFGKYFVDKISANELDSLYVAYPALTKADSVVSLQVDSILVVETAPGKFDVIPTEGVSLQVARMNDGKIMVENSKGLFAFPEDKMEIAKKTGMWDDSLNDVQLAERLADDDFFKFLTRKRSVNKDKIIKIGKLVETNSYYSEGGRLENKGYYPLTNNTDVAIKGSDYAIVWKFGVPGMDGPQIYDEKGKDIPPHGTVKIDRFVGGDNFLELKRVKWKLSEEQFKEKYATLNGMNIRNIYQQTS